MTAQPTPPQPISLDPATLDALPHHPDATAEEKATRHAAALLAVTSEHPLDAMLAARSVAAWYSTMDSFREAAQPDLPLALKLRLRGKAVALSRLMTTTQQELAKRQAGPPAHPVPVPAHPPAAAPRRPGPRPAGAIAGRAPRTLPHLANRTRGVKAEPHAT